MDDQSNQLTTQESLDIITQVIEQTKMRYEENGNNITLWGLAIVLAGIVSFALLQMGHPEKIGLPWLLAIVPMFIYSFISGARKGKRESTNIRKSGVADYAWLMAGIFAMVNGFLLRVDLGDAFLTTLYLPFCVAALVTALELQNKTFVGLSIFSSLLAFAAMSTPYEYQTLLSSAMALVLFLIPGLMLRADYKRRHAH